MKLHCKIEIHDRTLSLHRKSQRSILAYVKDSVKDNNVCFYLWTRLNKQGTKYKVIWDIKFSYLSINHLLNFSKLYEISRNIL